MPKTITMKIISHSVSPIITPASKDSAIAAISIDILFLYKINKTISQKNKIKV